jgi:hypothetical protein
MRHWLFICPIVTGLALAIAGLGLDSYSMVCTIPYGLFSRVVLKRFILIRYSF